jgi:hypothetical protein
VPLVRRDGSRGLLAVPTPTNDTCPSGLFFSQYQEGSGFNKYLEIYNPLTSMARLDEYFMLICTNPAAGSCKSSSVVAFPAGAEIPPNGTYLICHPLLQGDKSRCKQNSSSLTYNGDDALLLAKGNTSGYKILDQVGTTASTADVGWPVCGLGSGMSTKDGLLIRSQTAVSGNCGSTQEYLPIFFAPGRCSWLCDLPEMLTPAVWGSAKLCAGTPKIPSFTFESHATQPTIVFAVEKTSVWLSKDASVLVLAKPSPEISLVSNTDMKTSWRHGLNENTTVACGRRQNCTFPGVCNTIWVENTLLAGCANWRLTNITFVPEQSLFTETTAVLYFRGKATKIPEATYSFAVSIPVLVDNATWVYLTLNGSLRVTAVADALTSEVAVCQSQTSCAALLNGDQLCWEMCGGKSGPCPFCGSGKCCMKGWQGGENGCKNDEGGLDHAVCVPGVDAGTATASNRSSSVVLYSDGSVDSLIEVAARDLDGFIMRRPGETIDIVLRWNAVEFRTVRALYNERTKFYFAEVRLSFVGLYSVSLMTPLGMLHKVNFSVACHQGFLASATSECVRLDTCTQNGTDIWSDDGVCKQLPLMAVKAANRKLVMIVKKRQPPFLQAGTAEVRLASGDVSLGAPVVWTASTSSDWLQLRQNSGRVYSQSPVAALTVVANASGLNDTSISGPIKSAITIISKISDGKHLLGFVNQTGRLQLEVEVDVRATAHVLAQDITLESSSGKTLVLKGIRESDVVIGGSLLVLVQAKDYERLDISRVDQQILLHLTWGGSALVKDIVMKHKSNNVRLPPQKHRTRRDHLLHCFVVQVFEGEIPASWIAETGEYSISWHQQGTQPEEDTDVGTDVGLVTFKVVESSNLYLIIGAVSAIVLGCLLIVLLVLVYHNQDRAKELVISFIQFEMRTSAEAFLEILDIAGIPCPIPVPAR